MSDVTADLSKDSDQRALQEALNRLLAPLAELCLARGMTFPAVEEMLKRAFVEKARAGHSSTLGGRDISRVSAATGLPRREVTRITQDRARPAAVRPSAATKIFTSWLANRKLKDEDGKPVPLKRQGPMPSFEALSQSITRDVHHRTHLEELCRLGLTHYDAETDTVQLLRDAFVPHQDKARMFGFLGNNVGDHMAAAVENVMADKSQHLELAIFADELTTESTAKIQLLMQAQWKSLLSAMVPEIESLIEADKASGKPADQRVRLGLYSYQTTNRAPSESPVEKS